MKAISRQQPYAELILRLSAADRGHLGLSPRKGDRMKAEHIIVRDATAGDLAYALECLRCGEVQRFAVAISMRIYIAAGLAFEREHRDCARPADGRLPTATSQPPR